MENIFQAVCETKIAANYLNSKLDPNFDNLKIAATKLAELCIDFKLEVNKSKNEELVDC